MRVFKIAGVTSLRVLAVLWLLGGGFAASAWFWTVGPGGDLLQATHSAYQIYALILAFLTTYASWVGLSRFLDWRDAHRMRPG